MQEEENETMNLIVDLDGTLAFEDHRRPLIKSAGWTEYFSALEADEPNKNLIKMLAMLDDLSRMSLDSPLKTHIFTGRCESVRDDTLLWLANHGVRFDSLLMRKEDTPYPDYSRPLYEQNFVTDQQLKTDMLRTLQLHPKNVLMVFDDRDDMVSWWRLQGFSCCQVREQGVFFNPETGEPV